ncbi:MAG: DEAD/DEAH box helicase [Alloprevotella sp.]
MYDELLQISRLPGEPRIRYVRLWGLLRRICIEQSEGFKSDYATLFSRLVAVCRHLHIDHRPADRFRQHARRVLHDDYRPTAEAEEADLADLCHFVMQVYGQPVPPALPQHIRPLRVKAAGSCAGKALRGVVLHITSAHSFDCLIDGSDLPFHIAFFEAEGNAPDELQHTRYLSEGANVMLLDAAPVSGKAQTLQVYMAILEPDYLLDVTALTNCLKPYGHSPLNYLIDAFRPAQPNPHILLGNMANQFMDDCINDGSRAIFEASARRSFRDNLLAYACLPDEAVSASFFDEARRQFRHISRSVAERFPADDVGIVPSQAILEPSFICPALGLRGRLDVMTADCRRVLELKSGKADTWRLEHPKPKAAHLMQMSLYGEMLRRNFNLDWNELQTYLFYSAYPLFFNERRSAAAIRQTLDLRNGIVCLLRRLAQGDFGRILPLLTPQRLNQFNLHSKLYSQYLLPQIEAVTQPLWQLQADNRLHDYFTAFVRFTFGELFLSKTSDNRPDSVRGFAATWTADTRTKLLAGNLLHPLHLVRTDTDEQGAVTAVHFSLPCADDDFIPNFNEGEMVQLYEADAPGANVTNRQLLRGTVTHIGPDSLSITLAYRQRSRLLFDRQKPYAVEHDATDSPAMQQVQNLFTLLTVPAARRELLLARRVPEADTSRQLQGSWPEAVSHIVLQAKQARDYYLLVGPPGTGKTNLALRCMVHEYLLERAAHADTGQPYGALLLTAYTNRAVDEICAMLDTLAREYPFDYLRLGHAATCAPAHRHHLLSVRAETLSRRSEAQQLTDSVPIVVGTVITLTSSQVLFRRRRFEAAIIDEASQLLEPQLLGLLCAQADGREAIGKFILIGDHKQLPAVVQQPEARTATHSDELRRMGLTDMRQSLFERLHRLEQQAGRRQFVGMLHRQGRMHPDICQFVNRRFYRDQLQAVPLPHQTGQLSTAANLPAFERFVATTRMGFFPVAASGSGENLRANEPEAQVAARVVEALTSLHAQPGHSDFHPEQAIGIIVPFRSQIACIRSMLRQRGLDCAETVTIDTVECYQGSQRDCILFSTTVSQPYQMQLLSETHNVDGVDVDRKLNVAVTRARKQFFLIGNPRLLAESDIYRDLMATCRTFEGDFFAN